MDWTIFEKGVFLVNLLGIIYNPVTKMILIGKRVNDPHLKKLSWVFPGGRPDYKGDMDVNLKFEIKENTGLDVDVKEIIFAKTYPEKREFLSIYYHCEVATPGQKELAVGNLKELKWINPSEVVNYFTTSIHPKVLEYLKTLE
ncbi:MAG TPA: NUDIX hydrolase [Candidatus Saccharimonadales bacterium]|nr:NUDIX hydrolase [Candidatus Saccharimonadales bacterium]